MNQTYLNLSVLSTSSLLRLLDVLADQIRETVEANHDTSRLMSQWSALNEELGRRD